jgi:hypothetical protein
MLTLQTHQASRTVTLGLDSANHPRMFGAVVSHAEGRTMKMQMVSVAFGTDGRMTQAVRTFMTRRVTSGTGDSKTVALSDADTARVRALTAQVLQRCAPG